MTENNKFDINTVIATAKAVITKPAEYYRGMPKSGGLTEPLIFVVVMAAAMGIITAVLSLFGSTAGGLLSMGFAAIIIAPISALIGVFIGAAILFVIWKLMGSEENYETAFRCLAAVTAIYPIVAVVSIIPYLGTIVAVVWATYLIIEASVAVHGRDRKTATIVFGIIGALMLLSNLASERAARNLEHRMGDMESMFEDYEDVPPEEIGKRMGEVLKGMQEGMDQEMTEQQTEKEAQ